MAINTVAELVEVLVHKNIVTAERSTDMNLTEYLFNLEPIVVKVYSSEQGDWVDVCSIIEYDSGNIVATTPDDDEISLLDDFRNIAVYKELNVQHLASEL